MVHQVNPWRWGMGGGGGGVGAASLQATGDHWSGCNFRTGS